MDDWDLVKRSREGDDEAFNALIHAYRSKIFQLCLKIVHDRESAEDLTQETFVHAFNNLHAFRGEARFYTWIYTIAHNLAVNYLRKKGRIKESELLPEIFTMATEEAIEIDPAILEAIGKLPPKQKEVFELYVIQRLPQKEIAAKLGIPHGTVRSRLFKARQFIRLSTRKGA